MISPFGKTPCGGTPEGELPQKGRAAPQGAEVVEQRLPAFRFLISWRWRNGRSEGRKTEAPPLDFRSLPGFRASRGGGFGYLGAKACPRTMPCTRHSEVAALASAERSVASSSSS